MTHKNGMPDYAHQDGEHVVIRADKSLPEELLRRVAMEIIRNKAKAEQIKGA